MIKIIDDKALIVYNKELQNKLNSQNEKKFALKNEIPTKLSELINDSQFIGKNEINSMFTPISSEKINQLFCDHSNVSTILRPSTEESCSYQDEVCNDCGEIVETNGPKEHNWTNIGEPIGGEQRQRCSSCGMSRITTV